MQQKYAHLTDEEIFELAGRADSDLTRSFTTSDSIFMTRLSVAFDNVGALERVIHKRPCPCTELSMCGVCARGAHGVVIVYHRRMREVMRLYYESVFKGQIPIAEFIEKVG